MSRATLLITICGVAAVLGGCRGRKQPPTLTVTDNTVVPVNQVGIADPHMTKRLLRGFYDSGTVGWTWTQPVFAVAIDPPEDPGPALLTLDCSVPAELINEAKKITVTAKVDGKEVGHARYDKADRTYFKAEVPRSLLSRKTVEVEFTVDKSFKGPDGQPRSLIVVGVNLDPKEPAIPTAERQVRIARAGYEKLLEERREKVPLEDQKNMMRLFHDIPVWQHMYFHNVQIEKNPLDLWMMQQLIYEIQPDYVI